MGPGLTWSMVSVASVQRRHSGQYECRPSNCHSDTVSLIVLDGKYSNYQALVQVIWSIISVASVQRRHSGQYECRPSNCHSDTVSLIVLDGK